jgi:hypothetical protein
MTLSACALVAAVSMTAGTAFAQYNGTARRTASDYDSYYQDEDVASPSDVAPTPVAGDMHGCDANGGDANGCGCDNNGCGCQDGCGSCGDCCGWCNLGDAWKLQRCENCWGITYGGWVELGYHSNNVPLSVVNGDLLSFGDNPGKVNANQVWGYVEKEAEGECGCWDWGFRADILYGSDAQKTQAYGGPDWDNDWDYGIYGWALPQLYVSVDNGPLNIKAGHFFTTIGYEVVPAPDNFFFTHSLTMFNSEPFTHTGVLASYEMGCDGGVTLYGGWTQGWDTGFSKFGFTNNSNFLGGVSLKLTDSATLTYMTTIGDMGVRGNGYTHSIVFDWNINDSWEYVLQSDYVDLQDGFLPFGSFEDQVGINQYLFYKVSDCVKVGGRFEWWQSDDVDRYEATFGVNIRPHANLVFRPEVRYDWGSEPPAFIGAVPAFAPIGERTTFNIDAIFTF